MEMEGMMQPSLIPMKLLTALPNIFSVELSCYSPEFSGMKERGEQKGGCAMTPFHFTLLSHEEDDENESTVVRGDSNAS